MKLSWFLRILCLGIILPALTFAIMATPASAQDEDLSLSPISGVIGDEIEVDGYTFEIDEGVYIYFSSEEAEIGEDMDDYDYYQEVRRVTASAIGEIHTNFDVPETLEDGADEEAVVPGEYFVYATYDSEGEIVALYDFTVIGIELDPTGGYVGDDVDISGGGFKANKDISILYDGVEIDNSGDVKTDSDGEFICSIIIPASTAGEHTVTVKVRSTTTTYQEATAELTVTAEITINPTSGLIGDKVTVDGTGFGNRKDVTIYFNNVPVILTAGSDRTDTRGSFTDLEFAVPAVASGTHEIKAVDTSNNQAKTNFSTSTSATFGSNSGYVGTEVTVRGTGFMAGRPITVYFAGAMVTTNPPSLTTDNQGNFNGSFHVPPSAAGTYAMELTDGTSRESAQFTVMFDATSAPNSGNVGTTITVSGTGFSGAVTIKYDANTVTTVTANADGTFVATFKAPASKGGNHFINVADALNSKQFTFTMDSTPPPTPAPLLPLDGEKVEEEVYFDWESVTDPSSVTYTLQIASKEEFDGTSIVLETKNLTDSEYTVVNEEIQEMLKESSKDAPYYWRVKAIDGASNESGWTGAGAFYIGFSFNLPQWLIYLLFGVLAVVVGILGFWLGRRSVYSI